MSSKDNKAKANPTSSPATKKPEGGAKYKRLHKAVQENLPLKILMRKYVDKKLASADCQELETVTGVKHKVMQGPAQFINDLRITVPQSANADGKQNQDGLRPMLAAIDDQLQGEKLTLTWMVSSLNEKLNLDDIKDDDECSHVCCEYDKRGKRLQGVRCIDPKCLTWESKAANQSRAHPACRTICHCGCNRTLCSIHKWHTPACH